MPYDITTLPNGLRVVGESIDHFRSVSVGVWVGSGSQYEAEGEGGLSHFIEHMVFKGTQKRSARQIAEEMDRVGGQLNAFTGKECTCFYAKVMDEHLPLAMDVLTDMVYAPTYDAVELEKEKGVVIEEIAMAEDTPEDLAHEKLMEAHFGDQPLARPILGVEQAIRAYASEDLIAYWRQLYRPQNVVLSVAGHYDWNEVVRMAEDMLGSWSPEGYQPRTCATRNVPPRAVGCDKDIEQMHICLGYPSIDMFDERNYELSVFSSVFGGAMSSRLFQKIREERGAAYTVYSYPNGYTDAGMFSVYAATNPERTGEVIDMILEEARLIAEQGMTRDEFVMAREQLKASYVLGLESTSARMQSLGRRMLLQNRTRTQEEVLERLKGLKLDDVNALGREMLTAPHSLSLVGEGAEKLAKEY